MYNIQNTFDKLKVCMLGNTYNPGVFSIIENKQIRNSLEKLVIETNEDLVSIEKFLVSKDVEVIRPDPSQFIVDHKLLPSMLTPRDHLAMIGNTFYMPTPILDQKWSVLRGSSWPVDPPDNFDLLDSSVLTELNEFGIRTKADLYDYDFSCFKTLESKVSSNKNTIAYDQKVDSAMYRVYGNKLYIGTWENQNEDAVLAKAKALFPDYECLVIPSEGHLDGVMFIAAEGLIFSSTAIDIEIYKKLFPGWRIVYNEVFGEPEESDFKHYKTYNNGYWILENASYDEKLYEFINNYISHWIGNISESSFDVNMLQLDKNNICTIIENEKNIKIMENYGIAVHVLPFRHFKFWDSGLHCLTADIHRES